MQTKSLLSAIELESKRNHVDTSKEVNVMICKFLMLLDQWNMVHNLTARKDEKFFILIFIHMFYI